MSYPLYNTTSVLRACACLFVLLACWQVQIFPFLPHYYLRYAFFYFVVLFLIWARIARLWTFRETIRCYVWLFPYLAGLLLLQGSAAWMRAPELGIGTSAAALTVTTKVLVQLFCMAVLLQACHIFARNRDAYPFLLWGAGVAFAVIVCTCVIQATHILFARFTQPWAQFMAEQSASLIKAAYPWLEARWPTSIYDLYQQGSYTQTGFRINGIYEEASTLAVNVGVFFAPLGFGLSFLTGKAKICGRITVALSLLILAGSTCLTGLALFAAGAIILGSFYVMQRQTRRFGLCFALLLILTAAMLLSADEMHRILNTHGTFSTSRVIITRDTLNLVREYPWLGIGRSNYSHYIVKQKRYAEAVDHDPELRGWKIAGSVPELSALPAFAAEYGIPVALFCSVVLAGLWRKLYRLRQGEKDKEFYTVILTAYSVWLPLAFVAGLSNASLRNPMFCLPFFFSAAVANDKLGIEKNNP